MQDKLDACYKWPEEVRDALRPSQHSSPAEEPLGEHLVWPERAGPNPVPIDSLLRARLLTHGQDMNTMRDTFDFEAAVAAHQYVPVGSREDMK